MTQPQKYPLVQLALDYPTVEEALAMAEVGVKAGVDILEAGTPLIVAQGLTAVGKLARAFPDYPILADYKTMDSGGRNVQITQQQGGHYMTVCANASDETVQAACREGKKTGIQVVVDTIGVKDQAGRALWCQRQGADMIYIHFSADERRAHPTGDGVQWVDSVLAAVSIPVGVGTFGLDDGVRSVQRGAELVCIGHPLITGPNPLEALTRYVQEVKSNYKPRR